LTYTFIEKPLRFGGDSRKKTRWLVIAMVAMAGLGIAAYKSHGFRKFRTGAISANIDAFEWKYMGNAPCAALVTTSPGFCMLIGNADKITVGILGDSTANSLVPGIASIVTGRGEGLINIGHGACPPIRGLIPTETWGAVPNCPAIVEEAYKIVLRDQNIKTVVMSIFGHDMQYWGFKDLPQGASLQERFDRAKLMLDEDIRALTAQGKKVVLSYDVPYSPVSSRACISRPYAQFWDVKPECKVKEEQMIDRYPFLTLFENYYGKRSDLCVFHQSDVLFTNGIYNFTDEVGMVMIRDTHHLSEHGSKIMAEALLKSNCRSYMPW